MPFLSETLAHEINHRSHFRNAMHERNAKPCAAMPLWAIGGGVLGLITALMGCNAVMICTKAVEQTVHRHLDDQLRFLASRDKALYDLIAAIQVEEDMHLDYASAHLRPSWLVAPLESVINVLTEVLIWLSTQGAVSRMEKAVRR
ncbi:MAG: demethoxyubiquinone hydroxylase family protein [Asticcacaulis sp.]